MHTRPAHIVGDDIGDGHEDIVSCSHRGQMQPQLQITHRVTGKILQLQTQIKLHFLPFIII